MLQNGTTSDSADGEHRVPAAWPKCAVLGWGRIPWGQKKYSGIVLFHIEDTVLYIL